MAVTAAHVQKIYENKRFSKNLNVSKSVLDVWAQAWDLADSSHARRVSVSALDVSAQARGLADSSHDRCASVFLTCEKDWVKAWGLADSSH